MVVIGADSHKRTRTVVAVDDVGRRLGVKTVAATSEGHLLLVRSAAQWPRGHLRAGGLPPPDPPPGARPAGCRAPGGPGSHPADGRCPPWSAAQPGKSDPIDAEAVALAALRHPDLPVAVLDGPAREVKLLVRIIAATWSLNALASLIDCGGTCTNSIPHC